jgi:membrane protein
MGDPRENEREDGGLSLMRRVERLIRDLWEFLTRDIWSLDLTKLTRLQAFGIRQAKVLIFVLRQFYDDKLVIRASSLTYSTLLAIVPFLAVVFAILKGIGLHMDLAPALANLLRPLGPRGEIITAKILEFVANAQTGALGYAGSAALLLTVYGILNKIDASYNEIWHVPGQRFWLRRLGEYTLLIIVAPLALFVILAATASVTSIPFVQRIIAHRLVTGIVEMGLFPYVVSGLLFTLIIWYVPNIRVRPKAALIGGFFSGLLWQLANWGFARFLAGAGRAGTREILFAGFAALPLFLLWIYVSWVIVLLGSELGFVIQNVGVMEWRELEKRYGGTLRRYVGLRAVLSIVRHSITERSVPDLPELAREVKVPESILRSTLNPLVEANILICSEGKERRYRLTRDPGTTTLAELLHLFQGERALPEKIISEDPFGRHVERLLDDIDASLRRGAGGTTLRQAAMAMEQNPLTETSNRMPSSAERP